MQSAAQIRTKRARIEALVRKRFGEISRATIGNLASQARVHYTSLARYFLYSEGKRTEDLRLATIERLAASLDVNPLWLATGEGGKQLQFWPILINTATEPSIDAPIELLRKVFVEVSELDARKQIRACRAAVAALLDVMVEEGELLRGQAHRCLVQLDAMSRSYKQPAAG